MNAGSLTNYTDFKQQPTHIWTTFTGWPYATAYDEKITDARGHDTTISHNPANKVLYVTHHDGKTARYHYLNDIYLTSQTDERGAYDGDPAHTTYHDRDGSNRIWRTRYPDGGVEQFTYNGFGQVLTHTMPKSSDDRPGGVENFLYDGRGRMTFSWPPPTPSDPDPQNHKTQYFYYESGANTDRLYRVIDPRGNATRYEYNVRGQITKTIHEVDGSYVENFYNLDGTLQWTTDEMHMASPTRRTSYLYDDYKRVTQMTNPMQETTSYSYAPWSSTSSYVQTTLAYSYTHTTDFVFRETSPTSKVIDHGWDDNHRLAWTRSATGVTGEGGEATINYDYDEVGNLKTVKDPYNRITTYTYDTRDRKSSVIPPAPFSSQVTEWEYDPASSQVTKETKPEVRPGVRPRREMEYDSMNRLWKAYEWADMTDAATKRTTVYEHFPSGALKSVEDPKHQKTLLFYDDRNLKTKIIYPNNTDYAEWTYDRVGNLQSRRALDGQTQSFTYDGRNQRRSMRWSDGADWSDFTYDLANRLWTAKNPNCAITRGYDDAGRLILDQQELLAGLPNPNATPPPLPQEGDESGLEADVVPHSKEEDPDSPTTSTFVAKVRYEHHPDSRLKRLYLEGTTYDYSFGYDATARLETIVQANASPNPQYKYVYNRNSFVKERDNYINGTVQVYVPDELNRMKERKVQLPGGVIFAHEICSYDALSRMAMVYRDEEGLAETFSYDDAGELTQDLRQIPNGQGGFIRPPGFRGVPGWTYKWDAAGNRTAAGYDDTIDYWWSTNALNQYTQAGYTQSISHGSNHEVASYAGVSYTYVHDEHLKSASSAGGVSYQLGYDALGRCVRRTLNGSTTVYAFDGEKAIGEYRDDGLGSLSGSNLYGLGIDEVLAHGNGVQGQYLHQDHLGSVTAVTNYQGQVIEQYRYDAFGAPTIKNGAGSELAQSAIGNRFLFTGREYNQFGFYEYRARAYHPALGRFMSEDPKGFDAGDVNLFRYCGNDPVDRTDPMGLEYDEPFRNPDAAARDFNRIYNAQSIHANRELGSRIYYDPSSKYYYYNKPSWGTIRDSRNRNSIPKGTILVGDAHAHGDYTTGYKDREGNYHLERVNRSQSNWRSLDRGSDKPSPSDVDFWHTQGRGKKEYSGYASTPGNKLWKQDGVDPKSRPREINPTSSDATHSRPPSAAEVDAAHQATGVPSLGVEAVNRVTGKL